MVSQDEVVQSRILVFAVKNQLQIMWNWTVQVLPRYLHRDTKVNYSNINRYYRFTDRDFNPDPLEFETSARATL